MYQRYLGTHWLCLPNVPSGWIPAPGLSSQEGTEALRYKFYVIEIQSVGSGYAEKVTINTKLEKYQKEP